MTPGTLKSEGRVAVLMGGDSAERQVSLQSGDAVVTALRTAGFNVTPIDTQRDAVTQIVQAAPDFCFIALHGGDGENGTIQALLELLGIPYTGSGVLGSALAMDKLRSKQLWQSLGLATPAWCLVSGEDWDCAEILAELGGEVFVKPVCEGSSFGMSRANTSAQLRDAVAVAQRYGSSVLVERFIRGPEYTVAILEGQRLPSICIQTEREFYDFEAKYKDDNTRFTVPSGLAGDEEEKLQALALQAFRALGCEGWGRVDFMRDQASGEFFLLEANTVPGLTSHSLVPMAASAAGKSFAGLLEEVIALGLVRNVGKKEGGG